MSERIGDGEREWARASEREGSEQHCRHSPTVTAPQPEDRGSNGNSGSGYDGGGRPHHPSAAQTPSLTASLWDHSAKLGAKREKKGENYSLCPSQDQVPDLNSCRTDNTHHTHTPHYFSFSCTHTYSHPHSLKLKHTSLLVAFWTSVFFFLFFFFLHCLHWPSELSGFTFILWRTMGLGWRGAAGTLRIRTEGSWHLLVTLLLFCGFWKAHTQTDDGKSVYFWETGIAKPLITDYIWSLVLHMERLCW